MSSFTPHLQLLPSRSVRHQCLSGFFWPPYTVLAGPLFQRAITVRYNSVMREHHAVIVRLRYHLDALCVGTPLILEHRFQFRSQSGYEGLPVSSWSCSGLLPPPLHLCRSHHESNVRISVRFSSSPMCHLETRRAIRCSRPLEWKWWSTIEAFLLWTTRFRTDFHPAHSSPRAATVGEVVKPGVDISRYYRLRLLSLCL